MYQVRVGADLAADIAHRWGPERTDAGRPSEYDFWSGPLVAARLQFARFDSLPADFLPQIRRVQLLDPVFGALVFVGVLIAPDIVEIASVADDPDYWDLIADDPDD